MLATFLSPSGFPQQPQWLEATMLDTHVQSISFSTKNAIEMVLAGLDTRPSLFLSQGLATSLGSDKQNEWKLSPLALSSHRQILPKASARIGWEEISESCFRGPPACSLSLLSSQLLNPIPVQEIHFLSLGKEVILLYIPALSNRKIRQAHV